MGKTKLLVAGLALAGLTLAGCGGGETPGVAGTPNPGNVTTTAAGDAGTGAFDSIKALSDAVTAKSSDAQSAKMTMKTSAAGQNINAEGEFRFAGADTVMNMTMEVPGFGEMEMRLVEGIMYIKMPAGSAPDSTKPWLKIDPSDSSNPMAAQMGSLLDTAEKADPRNMLEEFAKVGEIKDVKSDTIDGQDTQKYTIELELAKLAEDNNLGIDKATAAELEKAGMKTIVYDVWVNDDNLPVRIVSEMTVQNQDVKVQVDYSDWGVPVDVEAPAASEIGEFPGN
ncbi:hypothetical protein [Actinokineospora fastidiosa]|uniref:Lipoprotein n=1 Tax=Actinokineospora fastidiosa TaxID=1816 RepID=A0A918LAJ0_9PSEU|nr:hypothetical protein [Actinokineospora fastidiosa]GGS25751.1 hypothetical protein GCM10010171_18880 [Actinokineospora fastidiosa]